MSKDATRQDRFNKGMEMIHQMHGEKGEAVIAGLREVSPDLADWIAEFAFGDVYARPELDLKTRQLLTVAAITAMGVPDRYLKVHINTALNLGWTRKEVLEAIMQMAVYAGFPYALQGCMVAKEVFEDRDKESRE